MHTNAKRNKMICCQMSRYTEATCKSILTQRSKCILQFTLKTLPYFIHSLSSSNSPCRQTGNLVPWPWCMFATWFNTDFHISTSRSPSPLLEAAQKYKWFDIDCDHLHNISQPFLFPAAAIFFFTPAKQQKQGFQYCLILYMYLKVSH